MNVVDSASLRAYKRKYNFFGTPDDLADRMADMLPGGIGVGARILEPSAGAGSLIRAIFRKVKFPVAPAEFCEIQESFVPGLVESGAVRVGSDFLGYSAPLRYDAIVMNPPFARRQDVSHVDHAWDCLAPGGRIVAVVSAMAGATLCEEYDGHVFWSETLPAGTFSETPTKTCLLLILKPLDR